MSPWRILGRQWLLTMLYAGLALVVVSFTRFDGGIAWLWGSTALLIAALLRSSTRHWWAPLLACGTAGFLVTGFFGMGWMAAPPLAALNLFEAILAARLIRRSGDAGDLMASFGWFARFLIAAGLIAPMAAAPFAAGVVWTLGGDPSATILRFVAGHGLGNVLILPLALLLTGRAARRESRQILARRRHDALIVFPVVAGGSALVFWQAAYPLLFLPVMGVVLATFRLGRLGAALAILILALIGGPLTMMGHGPISLIGFADGERMQFLQLYLAATLVTVLPIAMDLHHKRRLLDRVRRSEERFRMLAEHSSDLLLHLTNEGRFRYVSPSVQTIGGYAPKELQGRHAARLIAPEWHQRVLEEHRETIAAGGGTTRYEYVGVLADGSRRWFETHARVLFDEAGNPDGVLSLARDISQRKAVEKELTNIAMTDTLTGLPNRRAFADLAARRKGAGVIGRDCLAIVDIDRFKSVNDTYGHDTGDAVLKNFAELARQLVRTPDMVARLGGEEFVILFEDTDVDQAYQLCDRMRRIVAQTPLATPSGPVRITLSGGVAMIGTEGLEATLRAADEALYRAKRGGRDQLLLAA